MYWPDLISFLFVSECGPKMDREGFWTLSENVPPNMGKASGSELLISINFTISDRFLKVFNEEMHYK